MKQQISWCPGAAADGRCRSCLAGGAGPRGAGPQVIAQRGVLPDHGPPRAAAGPGLCIDVRVQILLHHPGTSVLGSTSGSSARAARAPLKEVVLVFVALRCGNSGARLVGTADEAFLKW